MITNQQKDTLNEYARVKIDLKALEMKADELKPQVLEAVEASGAEEIELPTGTLSLGSRRTWTYSKETQDKEAELKEIQKNEQRTGAADYKESKYCIFSPLKEE